MEIIVNFRYHGDHCELTLKITLYYLLTHCYAGRKNWASKIKDMLYEYGYGYIWETQGLSDTSRFLHDLSPDYKIVTDRNGELHL